MMKQYERLFQMKDPKNTSALCSDELLNKNRMNIIMNFVGYTKTAWDSANCDECYGGVVSMTQNFSQSTENFLESHKLLNQCIQNNTKNNLDDQSIVCTACESRYETLNGIFEQIKKSTGNRICFDLEDKVSCAVWLNVSNFHSFINF